MSPSTAEEKGGRKRRLRDRLFRRHPKSSSNDYKPSEATSSDSITASWELAEKRNANAVSQNGELSVSSHRVLSLSTSQSPQHSTNAESISTPVVPIDNPDDDMWSAAYSEAVQSFNAKVENLAITGNKISDLLQGLKESSDNLNDSLFSRGLRRLKVPLENIKLVLDLTSPLAALDPTFATATATAAVKGVTAVAVGICGAEERLQSQIVDMLKHISIIDECDNLSQDMDGKKYVHDALVTVYGDLLEFYVTAVQIFSAGAVTLALISEQFHQRLPPIVEEFINDVKLLRHRMDDATTRLVQYIKDALLDNKINEILGLDKRRMTSEFHYKVRDECSREACEVAIKFPEFKEWCSSNKHQHLVLFGNMGSGKTVTMCYLIEELFHLKEEQQRPLVFYHYCRADETGRLVYIYANLILQLLDQHPSLKIDFEKWHKGAQNRPESLDPAQSSQELGDFFSSRVQNLRRPIYVAIDGLDECDSITRMKLVRFLNELSRKVPKPKVLLSSRGLEETITPELDEVVTIFLDPNQKRDELIAKHLVEKYSADISDNVKPQVIEYLVENARGSAIWIKLTVEYICKRKITKPSIMKRRLETLPLPKNLTMLYGVLFSEMTKQDSENEKLASRALEILAVAQRPLSLGELSWAVALSTSETPQDTVKELEDSVDEEQILNLLHPLLHRVDAKDVKGCQLRLVHHSLKELILQREPGAWTDLESDVTKSHEPVQQHRLEKLNAALLQLCVRYLLFDEFNHIDLFSSEEKEFQIFDELPFGGFVDEFGGSRADGNNEIDGPRTFDPAPRFGQFFAYASCFWLDHFTEASAESLISLPDIAYLCRASSKTLSNWVAMYCRPDFTITPKYEKYATDYRDPLTVLCNSGPDVAFNRFLEDYERYSRYMAPNSGQVSMNHLILHSGEPSRLAALFLHPMVGREIRTIRKLEYVMIDWENDRRGRAGIGEFLDLVMPLFILEGPANDLLCAAARHGWISIAKMLFEEAARNPSFKEELLYPQKDTEKKKSKHHLEPHQSVGEAASFGEIAMVRYLLEQDGIEAHLRYRDDHGNNVFHRVARRNCDAEMFELLIAHFKDGVDQLNDSNETPLDLVVFDGTELSSNYEAAEVLLRLGGANVRGGNGIAKGSEWDEPLRRAARTGQLEMCRVLVEVGGADPRSVLREDGELIDPFTDNLSREQKAEILDTLLSYQ